MDEEGICGTYDMPEQSGGTTRSWGEERHTFCPEQQTESIILVPLGGAAAKVTTGEVEESPVTVRLSNGDDEFM